MRGLPGEDARALAAEADVIAGPGGTEWRLGQRHLLELHEILVVVVEQQQLTLHRRRQHRAALVPREACRAPTAA